MALPAAIQAAITRIRGANNNVWNAITNPLGHGQGGHRQNFIPDMNAVLDVGLFVAERTDAADADATQTAADRVQTGKDVTSSGQARDKAQLWANAAEDLEVEAGKFSAFHWVRKAIAQVGLAKTEADRSKIEADRSQGFAAGLKMPAISADVAGRYVRVAADGSVYELGEIKAATAQDIVAGTGTGFANAQTLGPVLNEMRAVVGDVIDSLNTLSARSSGWIEATNQVLVRATYSQLFALIGTRYNDFGTIASGAISGAFWGGWGVGLISVAYMADGVIYALTYTYVQGVTQPKIFRSVDDGLTFSEMTGTSAGFSAPADVIPFKGGYIAPPYFTYDTQNGVQMRSLYSSDGLAWNQDSDGITSSYCIMSYASSASFIAGIAGGTSVVWYKSAFTGPWTQASLPQQTSAGNRSSLICLNDVFYYVSSQGNVYKSANPGSGWTSFFNHPSSQSNTRGAIFLVLGNLYVIAGYGEFYTLYRITEAGVATRMLTANGNLQVVNPDIPNFFSSVQTDGKGRVLLFASGNAFVLQPDGTTNKLNFNFNGFLTSEPVFLRRSDGLSLRIDSNAKTVVNRAKVAVADTDFQMPTLNSPTPGMRRFVRAKP